MSNKPELNREPLIRETVETVWRAWTDGAQVTALRSALIELAEGGNGAAEAANETAAAFTGEPLTLASAGDIMLAARRWGHSEPVGPVAAGFGAERRATR